MNSKAVANREISKCAACEVGKGNLRSNKLNKIKNDPMKEQYLNEDHILTRQMVSADHYIFRGPGRLYLTKDKSDTSVMFSGRFIY